MIFRIILGGCIAVYLLHFFANLESTDKALENAALQEGTSVVRGHFNGQLVHCEDSSDIALCLENYNTHKTKKSTVLWLSNSQLHAINQMTSEDKPASALLHQELISSSTYLISMSQANANLQEHFVALNYIADNVDLDILVLSVFFDDLRETGIRASIKDFYPTGSTLDFAPDYLKRLVGYAFDESNMTKSTDNKSDDLAGLQGSIQLKVEDYLSTKLSKTYAPWKLRGELRGNIGLFLYKLRNFIFQIDATTIRKLIPVRYQNNISAFEEILKYSNKNKIEVLVYIPPIRNDFSRPYDQIEYSGFKYEVETISAVYGAHYVDLENLIPNNYWGKKQSTTTGDDLELDFMHFQGQGHQVLSNALEVQVKQILGQRESQ